MPNAQMQACIDACDACALACEHCSVACLAEPNVKDMARCIALDMDCADICRLASSYMARNSEQTALLCETCAGVCERCAEECGKHKMDHCQACADACNRCAEACRQMNSSNTSGSVRSGQGAGAHH